MVGDYCHVKKSCVQYGEDRHALCKKMCCSAYPSPPSRQVKGSQQELGTGQAEEPFEGQVAHITTIVRILLLHPGEESVVGVIQRT